MKMRLPSNFFALILSQIFCRSSLSVATSEETSSFEEIANNLENGENVTENATIEVSVEILSAGDAGKRQDTVEINFCDEPSSTDQFLYLFIFIDQCYAFTGSGPRWSEMTGWAFDENSIPSTSRVSPNGRRQRLGKDQKLKTTIFSCGNGKRLPPFAPIVHILNASWFLQASTSKSEEKEQKTAQDEGEKKNGTVNGTETNATSPNATAPGQTQNKSNPDDDWCMMVNFFSPGCPFSARLAPFYNALPRVFPRLLYIAAVDATESSRLNLIYGVAGTPTIMLFHNGKPVARLDDGDYALQRLVSFVTEHTDLKPLLNVDVENEDLQGPLPSIPIRSVDYYLILAWIFLITCSVYYGSRTSAAQRLWETLCRNWREMEEGAIAERAAQ